MEVQKEWRALAVFPDTFDIAAAAAVWMCDADAAQDVLSDLVKGSLLDWITETARYRLHDLARVYADSCLSDSERAAAQERHASHYETVLKAANELFLVDRTSVLRGLTLFDNEWVNIQTGQAWAEAKKTESAEAMRLCVGYGLGGAHVLDLRLNPSTRVKWLEAGLTATRQLKLRDAEGVALSNLGITYLQGGDIRKAIGYFEQRLAIAREVGNRIGEATALLNLGSASNELGGPRKAIEHDEQALLVYREIGERLGEGNSLGNLGLAYAKLGKTRKAIEYYEEALLIEREIGDRRGEGTALGNLGRAYDDLGETRKATGFYEQALLLAREIGARTTEGGFLWNLSLALYRLGEHAKAIFISLIGSNQHRDIIESL